MKNKFLLAVSTAAMVSNIFPAPLTAAEETVLEPVKETVKESVSKTDNDTSAKMEALKNEVETAQKEVLKAQAELDAIDARLEAAQNEVEAKNEYVETTDAKKQEIAKNADAESSRLLTEASNEYWTLKENLAEAQDEFDSLKKEQDELDEEYQKAVEESKQAEEELEKAKQNYDSLNKEDLDTYESKKSQLESQIYFLNESIEEANQKLLQLEAEKNQANAAANAANENYQNQKALYDQAQQNLNAASQEVAAQQALVSSLEDPETAANAQSQLQQAQAALSNAQAVFNQQQVQVNNAQAAFDEAFNKIAAAEANYNSVVENELNPAKEQRETLVQEAASINGQIGANKALIEKIQKEKEDFNSKIAEAEKIAEASKTKEAQLKQEAEKLEKEIAQQQKLIQDYENQIKEKQEAHAKGSLGFFEYVYKLDPNINNEDAIKILKDSHFSNLVHLGDSNDGTNLENMRTSLKIMQDANTIRKSEGLSELKVNNVLMALAQTRINYNRDNGLGHAPEFGSDAPRLWLLGENLNYDRIVEAPLDSVNNPFETWYREEKTLFEQLGGHSVNPPTGHYESIVRKEYNVTGSAYVPSMTETENTYFNGKNVMLQMFGNIEPFYVEEHKCLSVEDYIKQFDEYYESISQDSIDELEAKKAEAQKKLDDNQKILEDIQNNQIPNEQRIQAETTENIKNFQAESADIDARIEGIQNSNKNLAAIAQDKQNEANKQQEVINELQSKADDAMAAYEKANQLSSEAFEKLTQEKIALQDAGLEVSKAENSVKEKQAVLDNLGTDLNDAVKKLKDLTQKKDEAAKKAEEEKTKLDTANTAMIEAAKNVSELLDQIQTVNDGILEDKNNIDAASKELDNLDTDYKTISDAVKALENAHNKFSELSANADEILSKLVDRGDQVFEAKNTLDERHAYFDQADEALKEVEKAVGVWKNVKEDGNNSIVVNMARISIEDVPNFTEDYTTVDTKFATLSSLIEAYKMQREILQQAVNNFMIANDNAEEINEELYSKMDEIALLEAKLEDSKKALEEFILSLEPQPEKPNTSTKPNVPTKPAGSDKDKTPNSNSTNNINTKKPGNSQSSTDKKSTSTNVTSVTTSANIESAGKHIRGLIASLGLIGLLAKKRKENE